MKLKVTARHMDLDGKLKAFIDDKIAKIDRHIHRDTPIALIVSKEKHAFLAEISLHDRGADFHSRADHVGVQQAVEAAVDKLDAQLLRHKDRLAGHAKGAAERTGNVPHEDDDSEEMEEMNEDEE